MTASIATLGPNSARITYTAGTLLTELMAQVETYLLLRGWTVWDAAAGPSAMCYRTLQPGGTAGTTAHYHYIVLDYATSGALIMRVWESWDAVAHVGTNKAMNTSYLGSTVAESAMGQRIDLVNGGTLDIHAVTAPAPLVLLWSVVAAGSGSPSGGGATVLFTRERSGPNDTLAQGYCSSGWLNTAVAMRTNITAWRFSLPRAPVVGATSSSNESGGGAWINCPGLLLLSVNAATTQSISIDLASGKIVCADLVLQGHPTTNVNDGYVYGRAYSMTATPVARAAQNDDLLAEVDSSGFLQRDSAVTSLRRVFASTQLPGAGLAVPW